jgi:hypothetical protein
MAHHPSTVTKLTTSSPQHVHDFYRHRGLTFGDIRKGDVEGLAVVGRHSSTPLGVLRSCLSHYLPLSNLTTCHKSSRSYFLSHRVRIRAKKLVSVEMNHVRRVFGYPDF